MARCWQNWKAVAFHFSFLPCFTDLFAIVTENNEIHCTLSLSKEGQTCAKKKGNRFSIDVRTSRPVPFHPFWNPRTASFAPIDTGRAFPCSDTYVLRVGSYGQGTVATDLLLSRQVASLLISLETTRPRTPFFISFFLIACVPPTGPSCLPEGCQFFP